MGENLGKISIKRQFICLGMTRITIIFNSHVKDLLKCSTILNFLCIYNKFLVLGSFPIITEFVTQH